ncbi:MAG TPA: zf-HC2 domain-containing protein [Fimbriimonadaceae bacterium]|nr:zf-HC2 domain-containing protein [Fimbriimonadaceae bacterium]
MKLSCARFKKLIADELDRNLTHKEEEFLDQHRDECPACRNLQTQSSMAMNFLRSAAIEVDVNPAFEERVIRRLKVETTRESIRYWSPAVAGAFVAGLAVVAALQIITRSAEIPPVRFPGAESRRITSPKSNPALDRILNTHIQR